MKIATWNVNSLRVRIEHVCDWLNATQVDLLALQELKLTDDKFPKAELETIGYHCYFIGQPTYNGVAILSRKESLGAAHSVTLGNPHFPDEQKRLIRARFAHFDFLSAYFPNGQALDSEKYIYKLAWIDGLIQYLLQLQKEPDAKPLVLAGDFNIAPEERDTHDPAKWEGQILCSVPERDRFRQLISMGFIDSFREFEQAPRSFSWWDYRELGFRKNSGLRIDHILVDQALKANIKASHIDKAPRKLEKPSDHTPVVTELSLHGLSS
jgi:exodeoxyribonuclease III